MPLPSGENTVAVTSGGQIECAVTVTAYNAVENLYTVLVEGRIRNVGTTRVSHSNTTITCSISGQASFTGSPFGYNLDPGEVLTFISHTFNLTQVQVGSNGLNFTVGYGDSGTSTFGSNHTCSFTLVVRPAQPGSPQFTNLTPVSVTVSWAGSASNGGASIVTYKLRRWHGPPGHGDYVDSDASNRTRNITGLVPGQLYSFAVYAYNKSSDNDGYSDASDGESVTMLSGAWIRVGGAWYIAIPYVRSGGKWKLAEAHVRHSGVWDATS